MNQELKLRRKWTFRAHGKQMVFIKNTFESDIHVLTKALVWSLYLPDYPDLSVEISIKDRYKPDLVQLDNDFSPVFWAEAGRVSQRKSKHLLKRYRSTHLVFAKWQLNLMPFKKIIAKATDTVHRTAPVDLIAFPKDCKERFIRPDGTIQVTHRDVTCIRF
jgi:hypothetical protein